MSKPKATPTPEIDASDVAPQIPDADGGFIQDGLFVFDAVPVIRNWPVVIKLPIGGGEFQHHVVRMDFEYSTLEELQALQKSVMAFMTEGGVMGAPGDPLLMKIKGWSGIAMEGQGEVSFSVEACSKFIANTYIRRAVLDALQKMATGIEEKNFETPPAGGQAPAPAQPAKKKPGK